MRLTAPVLTTLLALSPIVDARKKDDAILLSTVKTLTLRSGHDTSHRRVSAVPQVQCVGGNAKGLYEVDVMRCTNSGSEYGSEDVQWTCKAQLPEEFRLGSTDVVCEGYDSSSDPFVLKGSCGVEYRLILTDKGEQKYGTRNEGAWRKERKKDGDVGMDIGTILFWVFFAFVAFVILYSVFFTNRNGQRADDGFRAGYGGGGGGGGGGDDGHGYDDPPPPYSRRAPPKSKPASTSYPRYSNTPNSTQSSNTNQGWRPGFWTGAATGAAAGYGAGQWNANRRNPNQPDRTGWFGNTDTSPPGGYARAGPSNQAGPSNFGSSSWGAGPSNSSSPSSSRQESTGFGGTSRR